MIDKITSFIDEFQRRHRPLGFLYGVIKKYGEDRAGYQAALLTYYAFLSLFPLLLVATTVLQIALQGNPHLQKQIIDNVTGFFPVVGNQLAKNVHSLGGAGFALAAGIIITLFGARGVASAFRYNINHTWLIPLGTRAGFPQSLLKSLGMVVVGGIGFLLASGAAGLATTAGQNYAERIGFVILNLIILFGIFLFVIKVSLMQKTSWRNIWIGALVAAVGLVILQNIGGYIVAHQLTKLNGLYGTFAVVLGLLFWLYLQAEVIMWAMEINVVRAHKLWPRGLDKDSPTLADDKIYELYKRRSDLNPEET